MTTARYLAIQCNSVFRFGEKSAVNIDRYPPRKGLSKVLWSPAGLEIDHCRCVLSTLSLDHRLLIYQKISVKRESPYVPTVDLSRIFQRYYLRYGARARSMKDTTNFLEQGQSMENLPSLHTISSAITCTSMETYVNIVLDMCLVDMSWSELIRYNSCTDKPYALLTTLSMSGCIVFWSIAAPLCRTEAYSHGNNIDASYAAGTGGMNVDEENTLPCMTPSGSNQGDDDVTIMMMDYDGCVKDFADTKLYTTLVKTCDLDDDTVMIVRAESRGYLYANIYSISYPGYPTNNTSQQTSELLHHRAATDLGTCWQKLQSLDLWNKSNYHISNAVWNRVEGLLYVSAFRFIFAFAIQQVDQTLCDERREDGRKSYSVVMNACINMNNYCDITGMSAVGRTLYACSLDSVLMEVVVDDINEAKFSLAEIFPTGAESSAGATSSKLQQQLKQKVSSWQSHGLFLSSNGVSLGYIEVPIGYHDNVESRNSQDTNKPQMQLYTLWDHEQLVASFINDSVQLRTKHDIIQNICHCFTACSASLTKINKIKQAIMTNTGANMIPMQIPAPVSLCLHLSAWVKCVESWHTYNLYKLQMMRLLVVMISALPVGTCWLQFLERGVNLQDATYRQQLLHTLDMLLLRKHFMHCFTSFLSHRIKFDKSDCILVYQMCKVLRKVMDTTSSTMSSINDSAVSSTTTHLTSGVNSAPLFSKCVIYDPTFVHDNNNDIRGNNVSSSNFLQFLADVERDALQQWRVAMLSAQARGQGAVFPASECLTGFMRCKICDAEMAGGLREDTCLNNHRLSRCCQTLQLCDSNVWRECSMCGAKAVYANLDALSDWRKDIVDNVCPICDSDLLH